MSDFCRDSGKRGNRDRACDVGTGITAKQQVRRQRFSLLNETITREVRTFSPPGRWPWMRKISIQLNRSDSRAPAAPTCCHPDRKS
jgi:hypothetical protein